VFCPDGYIPAAKLWEDYVSENLELIYERATSYYSSENFQAWCSRGSPIDICEHLFLVALSSAGCSLASPSGQILNYHVRYDDHYTNVFQKVFPTSAGWQFAALDLANMEDYVPRRIEGSFFEPWQSDKHNNKAHAQRYPRPKKGMDVFSPWPYGGCQFHSLPIFYERESFRVVQRPPPWTAETSDPFFEKDLIENFGGWAFCLSKEAYDQSWSEHCSHSIKEYTDEVEPLVRVGRPGLEKAREEWEAMNCAKGDRSWERISRIIEAKTGQKPSHKSLRDWREAWSETNKRNSPD